ncbi:hypothetical protein EYB25_004643 [Talaromyces marneffei]|nr:hypothetical protein EYB25_004643 [Talaromyces marneffei]
MQFLSGIASLLTRPPPTTDPRSDPSASPDTFASHGGEEVEEPEGMSGIRTTGAPLNVPLNARIGNTTFLSQGHLPSGRSNMRWRDEASDERRLFPTYKKSQDDVPISVGQSFNKPKRPRVNQFSGFRPVDRITPKRKDSGPVRAWGESKITNGSAQPSTPSRHLLSSPTRVDNEHRALKRRRHSSGAVIDLVDDDERHTIDDGRTLQNRSPSVASVESPDNRERKRNPTRVFKVPEDNDPDEACMEVKPTKLKDRLNKPVETAEVDYKDVSLQIEEDNPRDPVIRHRFECEKRRGSDASESPDELQDDVAFRTNPESFASNRRTIGSDSFLNEVEQKQTRGVKRRLSPNDIRPTVFNSSNKSPNRRQRIQQPPRTHKYLFDINFFRFGSIQIENRSAQLFLDEGNDTIGTHQSIPSVSIPIRRINHVLSGTDGSLKCRFNLTKIEGAGNQVLVDIEFATEADKDQLCGLLRRTTKIREKSGEWMDKAFDNVVIVEPVRKKRLSSPDITESNDGTKPEPVKRQRVSVTLQAEKESPKGINQAPRRVPLPVMQPSSSIPKTPRSGDDEGVPIPVKTYQAFRKERETRSKARGLVDLVDNEPESVSEVTSGDRWSKPLVYPPVGKKKAEVNRYDLERLRDGEFLNDNLIGFYARFLEHYLERNKPEVSKRVYFFNSYFYATLTSPVKGRKGVNYQGVSKWTRNIDLFSHDYVVVPINENAHWYLAIICNLSTLKKRSGAKEGESMQEEPEAQQKVIDHNEIPETPSPEKAATPEETARDSLASMKIDDVVPSSNPQNSPNSDDEWPEKEENQASPPTVFHGEIPSVTVQSKLAVTDAVKRKKLKSSGPVYSIDQPTIITFDSLNEPRQHAIKVLKQYLMEESMKAKVSFEMKDIKGMTAKGIPLQPNYSDCGLYLLAYLEKFVQNPDEFVRNILRREMSTQVDWPTLKSGLLRRRLRDFLFKLHDEQESGQDTHLLVDAELISYLLSPAARPAKNAQNVEDAPVAEPEVIADSFQDKNETNDDAGSDMESVIQETQFSEQQGASNTQHEQEAADEPKPEQHVAEVVEVPKTPERELDVNVAVPDSSPVVITDSAPDAEKKAIHRDQRVEADKDIFEDMFEYFTYTRPRNRVEVQVPTVQVPRTPPARKPRKERTSPRQIKSNKKI